MIMYCPCPGPLMVFLHLPSEGVSTGVVCLGFLVVSHKVVVTHSSLYFLWP